MIEVAPIRDPDFIDGVIVVIIDPAHRSSFKLNGLSLIFGLTGAEMAICQLLSEGLTNKEIADARNTLLSTVKSQMTSVLNKTGCANRTALLRLIFKINPPFNR